LWAAVTGVRKRPRAAHRPLKGGGAAKQSVLVLAKSSV
jgi:hypothetical protein